MEDKRACMSAEETFDPVAYINEPRWREMNLGLHRIEDLLNRLGRPQDALRFVHVAGTNGKGSVCAYVSSVLQTAGFCTGLFTSPYIERFEERIRVNGRDIPAEALREITLRVREEAEAMAEHPTEFELMCAVALMHFARSGCDIVVLEVGLGGRWDATNVIKAPEVCVICRLGLDHTAVLGGTIEQISGEKAGIIKPESRVVCYPQEPAAMQVILDACAGAGIRAEDVRVPDFSRLHATPLQVQDAAGAQAQGAAPPMREFSYCEQAFSTQLLGGYQPENAALAIETVRALQEAGWRISEEALREGIRAARWPGRFELCARHPLFVVDGGHNPQGAQVLAETMRELLPGARPVFLIGVLADKDYRAMLQEVLPLGAAFVCITPDNPRAFAAEELARTIECMQEGRAEGAAGAGGAEAAGVAACGALPVEAAESIAAGVARAREIAGANGAVCAFGSLYSVGAVKAALREEVLRETFAACGFEAVGSCDAACLAVREEVRTMCSADKCGQYGKSWSCPPGCGTLEDYRALIASKHACFVVQTVGTLEDDFDVENMMAAAELHKERLAQLHEQLRRDVPDGVLLGTGACTMCASCTYPDAPCRFPSARIVSMEAAGLVVSDICKSAGVPYTRGRGSIAYTSCVLV